MLEICNDLILAHRCRAGAVHPNIKCHRARRERRHPKAAHNRSRSERPPLDSLENVIGGLKIEGLIAKLMYRALYKMHLQAVHGSMKTMLDTLAAILTRSTEPRIKLH